LPEFKAANPFLSFEMRPFTSNPLRGLRGELMFQGQQRTTTKNTKGTKKFRAFRTLPGLWPMGFRPDVPLNGKDAGRLLCSLP
jgi:hypothetical protein